MNPSPTTPARGRALARCVGSHDADRSAPSRILEHRARLPGGRVDLDTPPDGSGWFGLRLTLNLTPGNTPPGGAGRAA